MELSKRNLIAAAASAGIGTSLFGAPTIAQSSIERSMAQANAPTPIPTMTPAQIALAMRHSAQFVFLFGNAIQRPRNVVDVMFSPTCPDCFQHYRETIGPLTRDKTIPAGNAIGFHIMPRNDRDVEIAVRLRAVTQEMFPRLVLALFEKLGEKRKELSQTELTLLIEGYRRGHDPQYDPNLARMSSFVMHEYGWKHLRIGETPATFINGKHVGKFPPRTDLRSALT